MMRSSQLAAITLCLSGLCTLPAVSAQQGAPVMVLAHDLKQLGGWAQWTRRDGYCTLQIILGGIAPPDRQTVVTGVPSPATAQRKFPATQVWVLRADGTVLPVLRTATEPPKNLRESTVTYTYAFSESASRDAAAVAVMIDGRYFIERLERFPDEK
jgi:hypothetical protein